MIYEFRLVFMFHQSLIYLIKNTLTFLKYYYNIPTFLLKEHNIKCVYWQFEK